MTREEAAAALIAGSQNTNATYVNVPREQLLLALGAAERPDDTGTDEPASDVS